MSGASAISAFSSVVLPTPLRPTRTIFSPRLTHGAEARDDRHVAVRLRHALDFERHLARRALHRELDVRALDVRARQLGRLQPLDFLAARGAPGWTRVPAPKRAMKSFSCAIFFSRCSFCDFDRRPNLRLGDDHVVVAAGVGDDRLVVDVGDVRADVVQEMPIVRDDDQRAVVAAEELLEPVDRVEVEVVGRLVEQQRLGMAEERLRQQHAHLLSALQLAHRPLVQRVRECRGPAAGSRRRFPPCSRPLRRRCPRARRGACRLRWTCRPSAYSASRSASAFHRRWLPMIDGVDDAILVEGELVLAQHAELRRPDDRSALRRRARRSAAS